MDIKTIKEKIKNSEVVSFDVFDTLIMRKVLFPEDVFELVERYAQKEGLKVSEYKKLRIRSDYENPHILPTIYEIYDYLQVLGNITEDVKRKLLNYEVEVEQNVLIRREDMMELFNYAVALGKPVYLISDMYLPKSILQSILKRLNIHEYKDIFISCEYKKSKQDGLYTVFKKNMCEESFIHIGDNIKSDIEAANHSGIEGFLIKSALELLKISTYSEILEYNLGLEERCLIGLAVSRLFNSPFTVLDNNRRPCITEAKDIIYGLVAPITTTFMLWFIGKVKKEKYDGILFAARDGSLVKRMYEISLDILGENSMPKAIYFPTSRTICASAAMDSEREIKRLIKREFAGTPEEMLKRRFDLKGKQILPYNNEEYETIEKYVLKHQKEILEKAAEIRNQYKEFIKKLGIRDKKRYVLFDFVSSGTSQYFLEKFVDFRIDGLYFCWYKRHDEYAADFNQLSIDSFKLDECEDYVNGNFFLHYLWLESVFTDHKASVVGIENGKLKFDQDERSKKEHETIDMMQGEVLSFYKDYLTSFLLYEPFGKTVVPDKLFSFINLDYTNDMSGLFECIHLKDDFDQNQMRVKR